MLDSTVLKFFFETLAVVFVSYCIYHEEKIAKFERKAARFLKGFFKFCVAEIKEKKEIKEMKTPENIIEISFEDSINNEYDYEYEYLLNNVG